MYDYGLNLDGYNVNTSIKRIERFVLYAVSTRFIYRNQIFFSVCCLKEVNYETYYDGIFPNAVSIDLYAVFASGVQYQSTKMKAV